ncbi:MAG: substrate-binding domain-containing protein, partial [Candidatus Aenigmatarchaeota archaeon]
VVGAAVGYLAAPGKVVEKTVERTVTQTVTATATPVTTPTTPLKKRLIGFAHVNLNCPYYLAMQRAAYDKAAEFGWDVILTNAEADQVKQISDVESMLVKGIEGLIINPVTEEGPKPVITKCVERNIPVVVVDRTQYGDYIAYVGIDQWQAGRLQGEFIANELRKKYGEPKGFVYLIGGEAGCPATIGRGGGAIEVWKEKYPKIEYVWGGYGYYSRERGMKIMEDGIAAYGEKIDYVYAMNDAMALGALDALRAAKMTTVMVSGIDGQKEAYIEIMGGGQYKSTVVNHSWEITIVAYDVLKYYFDHGKLPPIDWVKELKATTGPAMRLTPWPVVTDVRVVPKGPRGTEAYDIITGTVLVTIENVALHYAADAIF